MYVYDLGDLSDGTIKHRTWRAHLTSEELKRPPSGGFYSALVHKHRYELSRGQ